MGQAGATANGRHTDEARAGGVFGFMFSRRGKGAMSPAATKPPGDQQVPDGSAAETQAQAELDTHRVPSAGRTSISTAFGEITLGPRSRTRRMWGQERTQPEEDGDVLGQAVSSRSMSDTADWDFRRREVRRNSRSAQEWVRDSLAERGGGGGGGWESSLTLYDHEEGPDTARPPASKSPGSNASCEGGRLRRRSRSATELEVASSSLLQDVGGRHRALRADSACLGGAPASGLTSQRPSWEAELEQRVATARRSAEKVRPRRSGDRARKSDFLPSELEQRSRLFNRGN